MSTPEGLLPAALRNRTSFVLVKLAALVRQECADQLAAVGLNQQQHAVLCCLEEFGPACQKDIAVRLGIDGGDLVAFVDGLQKTGLVLRRRDERDRRRQILTLTADGGRMLRRIERLLDEAEPGVLAALSEEQRSALHESAVRVLAQAQRPAWAVPLPRLGQAATDPAVAQCPDPVERCGRCYSDRCGHVPVGAPCIATH